MVRNFKFNVRVYGIHINDNHEILLSKEKYGSQEYIKFPGGGLEYGEGLLECLKRECKEEANVNIEIGDHFYTTDFFQPSILDDSQIISVYYRITPLTSLNCPLISDNGTWDYFAMNAQLVDLLSLPIDKIVAGKLMHSFHP